MIKYNNHLINHLIKCSDRQVMSGLLQRGIIASPKDYYVISPLPTRLTRRGGRSSSRRSLGDTPHVLIRAQMPPDQHELECASEPLQSRETLPLINRVSNVKTIL
jgi:hypothetical protein